MRIFMRIYCNLNENRGLGKGRILCLCTFAEKAQDADGAIDSSRATVAPFSGAVSRLRVYAETSTRRALCACSDRAAAGRRMPFARTSFSAEISSRRFSS